MRQLSVTGKGETGCGKVFPVSAGFPADQSMGIFSGALHEPVRQPRHPSVGHCAPGRGLCDVHQSARLFPAASGRQENGNEGFRSETPRPAFPDPADEKKKGVRDGISGLPGLSSHHVPFYLGHRPGGQPGGHGRYAPGLPVGKRRGIRDGGKRRGPGAAGGNAPGNL